MAVQRHQVYTYTMDCFRCGVCCHTYQPCLSLKEARALAYWLGVSFGEFKRQYADPRWPGSRNLLLRKEGEACVFLERLEGHLTGCRIYRARPKACREWEAAVTKRECIEGLKLRGLSVSTDGKIIGPARAVDEFNAFMKSL